MSRQLFMTQPPGARPSTSFCGCHVDKKQKKKGRLKSSGASHFLVNRRKVGAFCDNASPAASSQLLV